MPSESSRELGGSPSIYRPPRSRRARTGMEKERLVRRSRALSTRAHRSTTFEVFSDYGRTATETILNQILPELVAVAFTPSRYAEVFPPSLKLSFSNRGKHVEPRGEHPARERIMYRVSRFFSPPSLSLFRCSRLMPEWSRDFVTEARRRKSARTGEKNRVYVHTRSTCVRGSSLVCALSFTRISRGVGAADLQLGERRRRRRRQFGTCGARARSQCGSSATTCRRRAVDLHGRPILRA